MVSQRQPLIRLWLAVQRRRRAVLGQAVVQVGLIVLDQLLRSLFEKYRGVSWICFLFSKCSGQDSDFYLVHVLGPFASDEG